MQLAYRQRVLKLWMQGSASLECRKVACGVRDIPWSGPPCWRSSAAGDGQRWVPQLRPQPAHPSSTVRARPPCLFPTTALCAGSQSMQSIRDSGSARLHTSCRAHVREERPDSSSLEHQSGANARLTALDQRTSYVMDVARDKMCMALQRSHTPADFACAKLRNT